MSDKGVGRRAFLKVLAALVGGAGGSQMAGGHRSAEASYIPGTPSDTVDTNLTVQGQLVVQQKLGVGTAAPHGQLEVAGELRIANVVTIGPDGRATQCYYVAGPVINPPSSFPAGSWGWLKSSTWDSTRQSSWEQLRTTNGSWQRALGYSWGQLRSSTWGALSSGSY